ncbi:MAG: hypothetical protein JSU96_14905, partial [Acidobacteriota bacterium]
PENAIIYDRDRNTFAERYVEALEGKKERVPIEIGISDGTTTEITSGLTEGDRVLLADTGGIL